MLLISLMSTLIKQNRNISEVQILYWMVGKSSQDDYYSIQEKKESPFLQMTQAKAQVSFIKV